MIITLKSLIFERLKPDLIKLHVIVLDKDDNSWRGRRRNYNRHYEEGQIDLTTLTKSECEKLLELLDGTDIRGCKTAAADVRKYLKASNEGIDNLRARTVRQASWMLEHYFARLPHHTIFSVDDYGGNSHSGYYVEDVDYEPEKTGSRNNYKEPEYCQIDIWYVANDTRYCKKLKLYRGDCVNKTCLEILKDQGYVPETPKLIEKLRLETERFYEQKEKIGQKCVAVGLGLTDLDDMTKNENSYWRKREKVKLDHFGEAYVVIDVLQETDKEERNNDSGNNGIDPYRWHKWNMRFHSPSEDEVIRHLEADEDTVELVDVDIPVHPLVPCFDLKRHVRLRVHVNNLTPYQYNKNVAERLILPERDWNMINLLIDHSSNQFQDIVTGKGQSMNVLSCGIPGTGKTATAEVFAEFKERPLYTIQCSQLGLDASEVEKNLSIVMQRANRWNAVLLLDEADVYIRKRGTDLNQNAIVGAFLRVLEYASCILFMTTNLEDSVDDAITSRCIARLHYGSPGAKDQARIWKVLADLNGLELPKSEIRKITEAHPNLTGRDVKNLIKLASFVKPNQPIDAEAIEFALQFKPTD